MQILVTGGAGFIGSALSARLLSDGHEVVVIDNFDSYYDIALKRDRVSAIIPTVPIYIVDITDQKAVNALFKHYRFDLVCHFANQAGVRYSVENPDSYLQTNVRGAGVLFEAMHKYEVKRMVYASSSSIYGVTSTSPFKESEVVDKPVSIYAASKRMEELMAYSYYHQYGIETTCLRFFTVYGPWSRPDMAMLKFAQKMTAGEPIDVFNNGDLRRDFTYIDDIVDGFARAVEKPLGYEILNIGNGKPVQLMDFIEILEKNLGVESKKNMLPMQRGDVYETYADTTKARDLLGLQTGRDFEAGVKKFADWYQSYYV